MPKKIDFYGYDSEFPTRLRDLMERTHTSQEKLAEICAVSRLAISQWMNGLTGPDIIYLVEIAKYFGVSTDYLLGLTWVKSLDENLRNEEEVMELKDTVDTMLNADYKERFKAEYHQLKIRCEKLHAMIIKYEAGTLDFKPDCPLALLKNQHTAMRAYLYDLAVRAEIENVKL